MYKVIESFRDGETKQRYEVGDVFPREGDKLPSKERLNTLSTDKNIGQRPFIIQIEDEPPTEPLAVVEDAPPTEAEGGEQVEPQPEPPAKPKQPAKKKK